MDDGHVRALTTASQACSARGEVTSPVSEKVRITTRGVAVTGDKPAQIGVCAGTRGGSRR